MINTNLQNKEDNRQRVRILEFTIDVQEKSNGTPNSEEDVQDRHQ